MSVGSATVVDSGGQKDAEVRTYRGRALADILPQIREELGPDAIILREREGLVGGIGGFFAQRFVEVEARRGGPSIDVYDEDGELEQLSEPLGLQAGEDDLRVGDLDAPALDDPAFGDEPALAERAPEPESVELVPANATLPAGEDSFLARLREAAAAWADDADVAPPAPVTPAQKPKTPSRKKASSTDRQVSRPAPTAPPAPAPHPAPIAQAAPIAQPASAPQATQAIRRPAVAADQIAAALPAAGPAAAGPAAADPRAADPLPPVAPAAPARPQPEITVVAARARPATPARARSRGLRAVIARLLARPAAEAAPAVPPPARLDSTAAATISSDLTSRGAEQMFVSQLISAAAAHGAPFAGGLREAARAELARRIVPAPALPPGGGAIAFVGAGGSGKSQCAVSLATAYRRTSTLAVEVIALDAVDGGRELVERLVRRGVPVHAGSVDQVEPAVRQARSGGFAIVDTPATTPTDADAIAQLGVALAQLQLDAIYVALPATLGPQAARRALASFGALRPTAIVVTHADETDQLGVAVEIAVSHRIPLAYLQAGTDAERAMTAVDPAAVAEHLLP